MRKRISGQAQRSNTTKDCNMTNEQKLMRVHQLLYEINHSRDEPHIPAACACNQCELYIDIYLLRINGETTMKRYLPLIIAIVLVLALIAVHTVANGYLFEDGSARILNYFSVCIMPWLGCS